MKTYLGFATSFLAASAGALQIDTASAMGYKNKCPDLSQHYKLREFELYAKALGVITDSSLPELSDRCCVGLTRWEKELEDGTKSILWYEGEIECGTQSQPKPHGIGRLIYTAEISEDKPDLIHIYGVFDKDFSDEIPEFM